MELYGHTSPGHTWCCTACPFTTKDRDAARGHAVERGAAPWTHILLERVDDDLNDRKKDPRRMLALRADGPTMYDWREYKKAVGG